MIEVKDTSGLTQYSQHEIEYILELVIQGKEKIYVLNSRSKLEEIGSAGAASIISTHPNRVELMFRYKEYNGYAYDLEKQYVGYKDLRVENRVISLIENLKNKNEAPSNNLDSDKVDNQYRVDDDSQYYSQELHVANTIAKKLAHNKTEPSDFKEEALKELKNQYQTLSNQQHSRIATVINPDSQKKGGRKKIKNLQPVKIQ